MSIGNAKSPAAEAIIAYCLAEIPESVRGFEKLIRELKASGAHPPAELARRLAAAAKSFAELAEGLADPDMALPATLSDRRQADPKPGHSAGV